MEMKTNARFFLSLSVCRIKKGTCDKRLQFAWDDDVPVIMAQHAIVSLGPMYLS